jgi:hypothetical protein
MKNLLNKKNDDRSELISEISKIVEEFDLSSAKKILFDNGDSFDEFVGRFHNILNKDDVWDESIIKPLKNLYNGVQEIPEHLQSFSKFLFEVKKTNDNFNNFHVVSYFKNFINRQDRENNVGFNYKEVGSFVSLFIDLFHCYEDQNFSCNQKLFKIFLNKDCENDCENSTVGGVGLASIMKNEDFRTIIFNLDSYLSEFFDFLSREENKKFLIIERSKRQLMFSKTEIPGDLVIFEFDLQSPKLSLFEFMMIMKDLSSGTPEVEFTNLIKNKISLWHGNFMKAVLKPKGLTFFDFMENLIPLSLLSDEDILYEVLGDHLTLSELISLLNKLHPEDKNRIKKLIIPLI